MTASKTSMGSHFNDVITGNDNDNIIKEVGGSNVFYGKGGNDTFVGSSFNADDFYGDGGTDTVDYSGDSCRDNPCHL